MARYTIRFEPMHKKVTIDPDDRRTIFNNRLPSSGARSRTRTRSAIPESKQTRPPSVVDAHPRRSLTRH